MQRREPDVRLLVGNVLWANDRLGALVETVVAVSTRVDAVALCEVTVAQADALDRALSVEMPHAVVEGRDDTEGVGVWSRLALRGRARWFGAHRGIDATLHVGTRSVRLCLVHPDPPLPGAVRDWRADLAGIAAEVAETDGPVVVCGDFNAWRRALGSFWRAGFRDAHAAAGVRHRRSWPALGPWPRVLQLDRALVRDVEVCGLERVELPGSDHDGFLVELAVG